MTADVMKAEGTAGNAMTFGTDDALRELRGIVEWWVTHALDREHGGFHGEIDAEGNPVTGARKHVVMNARMLWFFSEAARGGLDPRCRVAADRAWHYFNDHFDDTGFGGAFWSLEADGAVADSKKQVYAQCFCIYALCAYYRLSGDESALTKARDYLALVIDKARDPEHGGYFEGFSRDWTPLEDMRLGENDMNAPKTMNTHLHLLEACTLLHRTAPDATSRKALRESIELLLERVLRPAEPRLGLYFDTAWNELSDSASPGHQVEASWLLRDAAESLDDPVITSISRRVVLGLAAACLEELSEDGYLPDAMSLNGDSAKHPAATGSVWWVQAEAIVGFLNAFELSGDSRYRDAVDRLWQHVVTHHIDPNVGEWRWLGTADQDQVGTHYLAGAWKGPYHNGRAMMEAARRLSAIEAS